MNDIIERVAKAIFLSRYSDGEAFWPDRLSFTVSGPPFQAEGYRKMARAAIEAMREPTNEMLSASYRRNDDTDHAKATLENYRGMIDAALGKIDA